MTENEWQECADPKKMLDFLERKASARKLRLFSVACCRRIWPLLTDKRSRGAVEMAERFTDDSVTAQELASAFFAAFDAADVEILEPASFNARSAAMIAASSTPNVGDARSAAWYSARADSGRITDDEQAGFVHDIFGNPFRAVTIDPAWLTHNDATVPKTAQVIHDERRFEDMPIVADALMDAGCQNKEILNHCRSEGPHVRGCWVIDLLLGKE